uniref:Uncharacterized protein n=1 Tax=Plectus sambesii TaxID=2011161 RepID=A0A914UKJ8_9BILA
MLGRDRGEREGVGGAINRLSRLAVGRSNASARCPAMFLLRSDGRRRPPTEREPYARSTSAETYSLIGRTCVALIGPTVARSWGRRFPAATTSSRTAPPTPNQFARLALRARPALCSAVGRSEHQLISADDSAGALLSLGASKGRWSRSRSTCATVEPVRNENVVKLSSSSTVVVVALCVGAVDGAESGTNRPP